MATTSLKFLASGGFGAVYKYDSKKGLGVVARKVFNSNMDKAAKHERNVLTKIGRHDNIVAFKGCGIIPAGFSNKLQEGAPFIDFEFLDGPSLWELSYKEEIAHDWLTTLPRLCDIFRGLLAAVNHVHASDFVHLDLKPNNVMVVKARAGDDFILKPILIDFGISQQSTASQQLQDHHGTDGYQPPEWWAGAIPTQAYDVWALGAVFYELLHGQQAVPINETLKRIKKRVKGFRDSNNNNAYNADNTGTAERKERLQWQKKYAEAMEKASSEIQTMPRRSDRFPFIVPNDVHALVLHMLEQAKRRPTLKEILASPLFKTIQEGEYEQHQYAKHRAMQKADQLESEKKQAEKQIVQLQDELKRLQRHMAAQANLPKPPKIKTMDIAVGTEYEDDLSAEQRKCKNLEILNAENVHIIDEFAAKIELLEEKLETELNLRSNQEHDFAEVKAAFENRIQQERNSLANALNKLQQANENNARLEQKVLQAKLAAQHKSAAPTAIEQQLPPDSSDLLAQAFDFTGISQYVVSRVPTETPKRTRNEGDGAIATKRLRKEPDFQHMTLVEYQSVEDIDTSTLPNVEAAWKALDWTYGIYQKNAGDISNPPDVLKTVLPDHSKESNGTQRTAPFEEWLMLVLLRLGVHNNTLNKRNIFMKLTGRSIHAYGVLLKKYKK